MVVGGYRSPFVYRPPYVSPVWVLTGVTVGVAVGSSRRKAPCPWYMAPQKSFKSGGKAVPLETWPMIVFDLARCGFCSRLDKPNGVSQHRHEVPGDSVNVRFDAWEAPIDGPIDEWPASVPTSHASVAIALVTYDPRDKASFESAMSWARSARSHLVAAEASGYALLTVVLVGVDDVPATKDSAAKVVTAADGRAAASAAAATAKYQFYEAPCGTAAAVHDVLTSLTREVLALAVARRQQEHAKDVALKGVADLIESEGWFTSIDPTKLAAAIARAEELGCHETQLAIPRKKLTQLEQEQKAYWSSFWSCASCAGGSSKM